MLNKLRLTLAGAVAAVALIAAPQAAPTAEASRCVDISVPKQAIAAHNGRWIQLTQDQWEFLRGIYVMNPTTPPGLPYGDRAVLAQLEENGGGLVFFIDGDKACTPMSAPRELVAIMRDVATSTINHEAGGL